MFILVLYEKDELLDEKNKIKFIHMQHHDASRHVYKQ